MNRRQFVRAAGITTASIGLAGCPATGDGGGEGDDASVIEGPADADVSVSFSHNAPEGQGPFEDVLENVPAGESGPLVLDGLIFQRAGPRGVLLAGDATNASDRPFAAVTIQVVVYDDSESDESPETLREQTEHGRLEPDETWQWVAIFGNQSEFFTDYFSVQALANYE